ncbi:uncharacterized protein LOC8276061 isoform X2 [Ricinus communis]|uniref:uncharacterized protein LOC8276061 isoform X2 n=1 Tax=Ricinus communis TaxID=3988 RepID=UPI00201A9D44|nr:uncharacterized protein LOC8276061 isoform X2 [Ricinus communis]
MLSCAFMNVNSSKKSSVLETQITNQIGGSRNRGKNTPISPVLDDHHLQQQHIHTQTQSYSYPQKNQFQNLTHLPIPFPPPQPTHQPPRFHYHHDHEHEQPISNHQSTTSQKPFFSTPHKRTSSIMTTALSHSPSLSSFPIHRSDFTTKPKCFHTPFSIRALAYKFIFHFSHARLLCVHLKVLVFISLPSLYFFLSNPRSFFILNLLSILAFLTTLLISLNLAIPRLPSIRLLVSRCLPNKLNSTGLPSKVSTPVIWSIGSNRETEKIPNSGSWVQIYSNGDVYEGEIHKGRCSGSGVYYYYMSGRYEGDWIDDKYDGYGVETWAKGSRYRGQYRQGLRHGIGVYRFYAGDVYAGEWSNGQCHGSGIHTCEDGSRYVGEFKWGVKHGFGHYHFRNGDTYAGEYFADKMHGFGVYQFGNGHQYEGAWHEGRRQGLGMYTFRNGEAQSGHWQNGVLDVPVLQDSLSKSLYAVSHSKVLNAVQVNHPILIFHCVRKHSNIT